MVTLFSYCVAHDTGAAPNPFWGICTLVICKPAIRRKAGIGDWIVGTGSKTSPVGDMSGRVVYVMKVTEKLTMEEYDTFTQQYLPEKVPDWSSPDPRRRLGDSIYDFSCTPPKMRQSVHSGKDLEKNLKRDISGRNALLSNHFWYFGDKACKLPDNLQQIVIQGPSHRSNLNDSYVEKFLEWFFGLGLEPNRLYGRPQKELFKGSRICCECS
jgi:hypothetical protein